MTDTLVVAESPPDVGYRFSWGLAIGGGVIATAVTFFLLTLGAGFGLLLVNPLHGGMSAPAFFTGGAIYFLVAQAFGFAIGGHFAGRLLGPLVETQLQEDIRAGAHALVAWAVAVLAALTVVFLAGLSETGAKTASLYTPSSQTSEPTDYAVDRLFRSDNGVSEETVGARAEAGRIIDADIANGTTFAPGDEDRLVLLTAREAHMNPDAAAKRVSDVQAEIKAKANDARKIASYASLWIAFSLLFGAIVAVGAAISARIEDDRQAVRV